MTHDYKSLAKALADALEELMDAMYRYQRECDDEAPIEHRQMMHRAELSIAAYRAAVEAEKQPQSSDAEDALRQIIPVLQEISDLDTGEQDCIAKDAWEFHHDPIGPQTIICFVAVKAL